MLRRRGRAFPIAHAIRWVTILIAEIPEAVSPLLTLLSVKHRRFEGDRVKPYAVRTAQTKMIQ